MLICEEEVKNRLSSILEEKNSSCYKNHRDNDQLKMAYSFEDSKSSDTCKCICGSCTCKNHTINVITSSDKKTFFNIINHIKNHGFRGKYLITLRNLVFEKQPDSKIITPFDMTNVYKQPIKFKLNL